jgi:hypothetical protein
LEIYSIFGVDECLTAQGEKGNFCVKRMGSDGVENLHWAFLWLTDIRGSTSAISLVLERAISLTAGSTDNEAFVLSQKIV